MAPSDNASAREQPDTVRAVFQGDGHRLPEVDDLHVEAVAFAAGSGVLGFLVE
ncbi:hypothetical protein [Amycolatopsis tolypomycina]|uniref:hypothetical protein n=1 Tax=Amycolatopsis tolypomycina TaxID=208445 RepID=UPI0033B43906